MLFKSFYIFIAVFKECFFFIAKRGYTTSEEEMGTIMRSLSYSPTEEEIHNYYQKYVKGDCLIEFIILFFFFQAPFMGNPIYFYKYIYTMYLTETTLNINELKYRL